MYGIRTKLNANGQRNGFHGLGSRRGLMGDSSPSASYRPFDAPLGWPRSGEGGFELRRVPGDVLGGGAEGCE